MNNVFTSAIPIIKKIIDPSSFLGLMKSNNTEYYQGSLILQIPEKSNDKLYFNVFNNFIYNNSSINQFMQGNINNISSSSTFQNKTRTENTTSLENSIKF